MSFVIDWLLATSRLTSRLCTWVEVWLELMPASSGSRLTVLHWRTIKSLDNRRPKAKFGPFTPGDVRCLVMDELTLRKGLAHARVIDRIRVGQANALAHDNPARKGIKRMAYGFRDREFFFLNIKAALPGIVR